MVKLDKNLYMQIFFLVLMFVFGYSESVLAESLPIPRFVSLKSEEVNVRGGPGVGYPIRWIIKRKYAPVEIIAEFEHWRRIRDITGDEGWVHSSMLSGKRMVTTTRSQEMLKKPNENSEIVARLEKGVDAGLEKCNEKYCRIEAGEYEGWVYRNFIWGVYKNEVVE